VPSCRMLLDVPPAGPPFALVAENAVTPIRSGPRIGPVREGDLPVEGGGLLHADSFVVPGRMIAIPMPPARVLFDVPPAGPPLSFVAEDAVVVSGLPNRGAGRAAAVFPLPIWNASHVRVGTHRHASLHRWKKALRPVMDSDLPGGRIRGA